MTKYTVHIEGIESGLTKHAILGMMEGQFPNADNVRVEGVGD